MVGDGQWRRAEGIYSWLPRAMSMVGLKPSAEIPIVAVCPSRVQLTT